jgi:hypothetical protein
MQGFVLTDHEATTTARPFHVAKMFPNAQPFDISLGARTSTFEP